MNRDLQGEDARLVQLARGLRSEHAENSEYDRALVELVADFLRVGTESAAEKLGVDFLQIYPPHGALYWYWNWNTGGFKPAYCYCSGQMTREQAITESIRIAGNSSLVANRDTFRLRTHKEENQKSREGE